MGWRHKRLRGLHAQVPPPCPLTSMLSVCPTSWSTSACTAARPTAADCPCTQDPACPPSTGPAPGADAAAAADAETAAAVCAAAALAATQILDVPFRLSKAVRAAAKSSSSDSRQDAAAYRGGLGDQGGSVRGRSFGELWDSDRDVTAGLERKGLMPCLPGSPAAGPLLRRQGAPRHPGVEDPGGTARGAPGCAP